MLVFCANMEPLPFQSLMEHERMPALLKVDLSNLKVRQHSAHILTLRYCLSPHFITLCNPADVKVGLQASLVVQWLRFLCSRCSRLGFDPNSGSRSHIPQLKMLQQGPPYATARTQYNQINKQVLNKIK